MTHCPKHPHCIKPAGHLARCLIRPPKDGDAVSKTQQADTPDATDADESVFPITWSKDEVIAAVTEFATRCGVTRAKVSEGILFLPDGRNPFVVTEGGRFRDATLNVSAAQ